MSIKNLKRIFFILFVAFTLVSCTNNNYKQDTDAKQSELVMITTLSTIDDGAYTQAVWEGLKKYSTENNKNYNHYTPKEKTETSALESIDTAVKNGAKVIIIPGIRFDEVAYIAQYKYKDVKFIMLDFEPFNPKNKKIEIAENSTVKLFHQQEAGFLAGYSIVKEGYTNIGFMGGFDSDAIREYGYGFIDGAEYAAKQMGLKEKSIKMKYTYTGTFNATPEIEDLASTWYGDNTDVIFACAGQVGLSVMKVAERYDKYVIGVDVDQSSNSKSVITSAKKNLQNTIYKELDNIYNDKFDGGKNKILSIKTGDISLEMENDRFKTFSSEDYEKIKQDIISSKIIIEPDIRKSVEELNTKYVDLNYVK